MPEITINGAAKPGAVVADIAVAKVGGGGPGRFRVSRTGWYEPRRLGLVVPEPQQPPAPTYKFRWAGPWAEMDAIQHVQGVTEIVDFGGRSKVLRCRCDKVTVKSPTKANREKHGFTAREGDTLVVGFDIYVVSEGIDIPAFRTWCDTESLSAASNEGSRLSDKSLHLAFNEKWASGANRVDYGKPTLPLDRWVAVEFENRMHRSEGLVVIRQNGIEVLRHAGPTMGPEVDRVQFGPANASTLAGVTAYYDKPWIEHR